MASEPPSPPRRDEDVEVEERQKTAVPKRYNVIFHNDDYTTMEYVVEVLRRFFHKGETEALHIMLTVHKKGKAIAAVYPRDVAEMALAHAIGDRVEAAYRRGDLFEKRRRLMADWAAFCGRIQPKAGVVSIGRKNAG